MVVVSETYTNGGRLDMLSTLTYAVRVDASPDQSRVLSDTCAAYLDCCNMVSETAWEHKTLSQKTLHQLVYRKLRDEYHVGAQMACSSMNRVIGNYRTIKEMHGSPWATSQPEYRSSGYDLVWNNDYSILKDGRLSINTLNGRIKIPVDWAHVPEEYRHGKFGTARLLNRNGKWLLLIPSTVELPDPAQPQQVVGVDMGVRFLATTYDSDGRTVFYDGREVKRKREHYKKLRASLQKKGTRSARRRLRKIGRRENRWMRDVNHQVSKALVSRQSKPTLFALENLSGVRRATEKVRKGDRYVHVSWAFYQLRQMIEYKANKAGHSVVVVDPRYTSQTCPTCGLVRKANRRKKTHEYYCSNCGYRSNDDRVAAMNIQRLGYQSLVESQSDKL